MADMDALYALMRRQFGLITRAQAVACGLTPRQIERLLSSGRWRPVRPEIYALAGTPPTWEQAVLAAVYAGGADVLASHATAGRLRHVKHVADAGLEVVAPLGRHKRLEGVIGHRSGALYDADKTVYRGIPVTTVARTLVDISGRLTDRRFGQAVDDAIRRDILRLEDLRQTAGRLGTAPGRSMRRVHRVLALRIPGYDPLDSDFETRVLRVLTSAGLPVPRQQYPVTLDGQLVHLDLAYPQARLAIELDGWEWHATRSAFDDDRWRDAALVKMRWLALRLTFTMSDTDIVDVVRAALTDRLLTGPTPAVVE
jgi:very-short-patch-repair endonuclease